VHDLVYLQLLQLLQRLDHLNDMDHSMLVHLFRCVVEIVNLNQMYRRHRRHQQDVEKMDVLQIPDEQNLVEVLTFQDVVRRFLVNLVILADVEGGELCHLLKMDYYQDVVDVELRHL
jgi:hypothetical protein